MGLVVAIVGPTASGKTRLAIQLAQTFAGEIVSADSRQVYRLMDIGTAKPTTDELTFARHHLIDIVNPNEDFSLAQYQNLATKAIVDIQNRGKLPLLVGGSGQYVWSVLEGWEIPRVAPDPELRRRLEARAERESGAELYRELAQVDPEAARKIDPRNVRRTIRALEVYESTGIPFSRLKQKKAPPFKTLIIGLTTGRAALYGMIDSRVDEMLARGLAAEVDKLLKAGYDLNLPAMSGIGYRQMGLYLRGEMSLEQVVKEMKFATHRVARQQYAWFQLKDRRIKWFDIKDKDVGPEIHNLVAKFIKESA